MSRRRQPGAARAASDAPVPAEPAAAPHAAGDFDAFALPGLGSPGAGPFKLGAPRADSYRFPIFTGARDAPMPGSYQAFLEQFIGDERRPAISYAVEGLGNTWIIVPADYDAALRADGSRQENLAPGDLPALLAELPDASLINVIVLLDERNPEDVWHEHRHGRAFVSGATATQHGAIHFYWGFGGDDARVLLKHEWSHLLYWRLPQALVNRADAACLAEAAGFYLRDLARANHGENFATHMGEAMLDSRPANLARLVQEAPVRAMACADALDHALMTSTGRRETPCREIYQRRIAYARATAKAPAAASLLAAANRTEEPGARSLLVSLLAHYGTGEDLADVTRPANFQLGHDVDVDTRLIERISRTPRIDALNISGSQRVNPQSLARLAPTGLWLLGISESNLGDAAAEPISRLTTLRCLVAQKTRFTDEAIPHLARLERLEELDLGNTRLSQAGQDRLRQLLPKAKVEF